MNKLWLIVKETSYLVTRHKLLFLLPFVILLAVLAILAIELGPAVLVPFIYAGV
jgi:hypothetical protein